VLLLDALVQLAVLAPQARLRRSSSGADLVPRGIGSIEVHTRLSDVALLDRHGRGIVLLADGAGSAHALDPGGRELLIVRGVRVTAAADARAAE
jgi:hypothetical protein